MDLSLRATLADADASFLRFTNYKSFYISFHPMPLRGLHEQSITKSVTATFSRLSTVFAHFRRIG